MKKKITILTCLIMIFISNTIVVLLNGYQSIDAAVRNFVMLFTSEMTSKAMHIITFFGSTKWIIALSILLFAILIFKKYKNHAFSMASMIIVSTVINTIIKILIRRLRPEYISVIEHSFSYPSGHTMAACTLYGFIIYMILKNEISRKYKILFTSIFLLLITLVGISRIYLGAHFFSDVFGGIILSCALLVGFDILNTKKELM